MSTDSVASVIITYDETIKQDSPVPEAQSDDVLGEIAITEIQGYLRKYSTTSSVFAEQSITNPDYQRTLYCISCILQAELFDDLADVEKHALLNPELAIETTLPAHLGGPVEKVPEDLLERECRDDPELRAEIEAGRVPTVDTILRFISWLHQSAKYSAQCNIIAFIYIKRMMDAQCILTMSNWRGMWLGSVVLAQKVWDDSSLRTSAFASILPGVTKSQLKALELKIFTLLGYCTSVKPSVYARFYFELREIFKNITGEFCDASLQPAQAPRRRPLTIKKGKFLRQCADDLGTPASARSSKPGTPRSKKTGTSAASSAAPAAGSPGVQLRAQQQEVSCSRDVALTRGPVPGAGKLAAMRISPTEESTRGSPSQRKFESSAAPTSACTPGRGPSRSAQGLGLQGAGAEGRRLPVTLEDYDYINCSSIFVIS